MAVTRAGATYPIESNPATGAPTTVAYTTLNVGDLVVLDVVTGGTGAAAAVCTAVTAGGCTSWAQVGASVTSTTGFLISTTRWMGVVTTVGAVTATATYAATPAAAKIDGAMFTDAALRPNVAWTVDQDTSTKITTATGTMGGGSALTSTGTNGVAYCHWVPETVGSAGSTSGWTYVVDGGFTNVTAYRILTATGSLAIASAVQSPTGSYARRVTFFQAAASSSSGTAGNASSATGTLDASRAVSGNGPEAAAATGTLAAGRPLSGNGPASSAATGVLAASRSLAGVGTAISSGTGTFDPPLPGALSGVGTAANAATGTLAAARPLSGTAPGVNASTGLLATVRALLGTAAANANSTIGTLAGTRPLAGVSSNVSATVGDLGKDGPPQPLPLPDDVVPPRARGWRPSLVQVIRAPRIVYAPEVLVVLDLGVDIRTFGVIGDGRDETTLIQAALDATGDGRTLWIPAGVICGHAGALYARNAGMRVIGPGELRALTAATCSLTVQADRVTIEGGLLLNFPDVQNVTITGAPTAGGIALSVVGGGSTRTTGTIAYNASTATMQTALGALSNVGAGNVLVTGSAGAWVVAFVGALITTHPPIMGVTHTLTGGTVPAVTVAPPTRISGAGDSHRLAIGPYVGAVVRDVTIIGSAATGIRVGGASYYLIERVTVIGSRADGIHNRSGSNNGIIRYCTIALNGDDSISVVSYNADGAPCHHIVIDHCIARDSNPKGRGFTVIGGHDIAVTWCEVTNSCSAGVYIATEVSFDTASTYNVTVSDCTITGASTLVSTGAIMITNLQTGGQTIDLIAITRITIVNTNLSTNRNVRIAGANTSRILLDAISITGGPVANFTTDQAASVYLVRNLYRDGVLQADVGTYVP